MRQNIEKKELQEKRNHNCRGGSSRVSSGGSKLSLQPAFEMLENELAEEIDIGSLLKATSSASIFKGIKKFYGENHILFEPVALTLTRETNEDYVAVFNYLQMTN